MNPSDSSSFTAYKRTCAEKMCEGKRTDVQISTGDLSSAFSEFVRSIFSESLVQLLLVAFTHFFPPPNVSARPQNWAEAHNYWTWSDDWVAKDGVLSLGIWSQMNTRDGVCYEAYLLNYGDLKLLNERKENERRRIKSRPANANAKPSKRRG